MSTADIVEFDLSPAQAGMLFESLYRPGAYVEQRRLSFTGRLNIDALARAWQTVVGRHDALRAVIQWDDDGVARQAVRPDGADASWQVLDMSEWDVERFVAEDRVAGFDLDGGPLTRAALLRTAPTSHDLVWTFHHLLLDGRSVALVVSELLRCYAVYASGNTLELLRPRQFGEYAGWLRNQDTVRCRDFWVNRMAGFVTASLLGGKPDHRDQHARHATHQHHVDIDLTAIAGELRVTANTLITACWLLLLAGRTGRADVTTGVTLSVPFPAAHGNAPLASLCIGTVPLRATVDFGMRLSDWLHVIQLDVAETMSFAWQSTAEIKRFAGIRANVRIFDSILVFRHGRRGNVRQSMPDGVIVVRRPNAPATSDSLVLSAVAERRVELDFSFDTSVLGRDDVVAMSHRMAVLLAACGDANTVDDLLTRASGRQMC